MNKQVKNLLGAVAAIAVIVVLGVWGYTRFFSQEEEVVLTEPKHIDFTLEPIAELALEEYNYTGVGFHSEQKQVFNRNVPFTGNEAIYTFEGSVKAGVKDATEIKVTRQDAEMKFVVTAPEVEIIESHIDSGDIEVLRQSNNPIIPVDIQGAFGSVAAEQDKAIDKAIDAGILERAQEELEKHLNVYVKSVVNASDWDQYEVEIRTAGDEEAEESEDAAESSSNTES